MTYEEIKAKYAKDSLGAFGNEKNPMKKHEMRAALKKKNSRDLEMTEKEYAKIQKLASDAKSLYSYSLERLKKQGPAIQKAYDEMKKAIDRLWTLVLWKFESQRKEAFQANR